MDNQFDEFDLFMMEARQPEEKSAACDIPEAPDIIALLGQQCGTPHVTETGQVVTPDRELPTKTMAQFPQKTPC